MWTCIFPLAFLLLAVMAPGAWAEEKIWGNQTELSFVQSDGNSEVTTFAGKNTLTVNQGKRFIYEWELGGLYGESSGERNSERYFTKLRGDYIITKRSYTALFAGWGKDNFAGIDGRYFAGAVGGYKLLNGPKQLWSAEAGADFVHEAYTEGTDSDFIRGRAYTVYKYLFTEKNRFLQSVEYLHDFDARDNYDINTVTSITSAISDSMSLKASYEVRYDNEPVPDILKETDTLFIVALVINI